jgi:outer membrane protein assembly factor BamB
VTAETTRQTSQVTGGFAVHLGCGDGRLTAEMKEDDAFVVHGLDADPAQVQQARARFLADKLEGTVSAATFDGEHLPYVDNMVNLLVCSKQYNVSRDEILRVLCPGGVALLPGGDIAKPWPKEYDEWTHYLHDADNNAVSRDTAIAAPLAHLQWTGSPRYSRHHDKTSSVPAVVSAAGKVFYIVDEGPRASILWDSDWQLVARDAFNGVVLWRKEIEQWTSHLWPLKSGPSNTPRRLVAAKDAVYVTLGLLSPVSKLDAAKGEVLKVYTGTEKTEEILLKDEVLYLVICPTIDPDQRGGSWERAPKTVMAVRESDGAILWQHELPWIAPVTLTVGERNVYLCDGPRIIVFDRVSGKELWKSEELPWRENNMPTYFAPTLVAAGKCVLYAGGENWHEHAGSYGLMTCLDATTGEIKWQRPHLPSGYQSPQDIFVIGNRVWCGSLNSKPGEFDTKYPDVSPSTGEFISYDLETGEPDKTIPRGADCYWFHHRCHRAKATENFFLTSRTGIEMIDVRSGEWSLHHWVRGACLYGIMPANGLVYAPPHPCACYPEAKLSGFNAVAGGGRAQGPESGAEGRLERGPAFTDIGSPPSDLDSPLSGDWPTYRGNAARSGSTDAAVGADLKIKWQTDVGGRLSQPVVAGSTLFVAAVDEHALYAFNRDTGKALWTYIAGGRIDSPPTICRGMVLFGSADGYVYCLRASDGALVWRFRAAPYDQRLMSYGQLESVWPVHGSVLIRDGIAYVIAGRSMFLDGGLTLYRLDPLSGEVLSRQTMDGKDPNTGEDFHSHVTMLDMPVASSDILSSEGNLMFMRSQPFDLAGKRARIEHVNLEQQQGADAHLFAPTGFLDDNWWHRSFWVYGRSVQGGPSYGETGNATPSGKLMVLDDENVYIFGRGQEYWKWTTPTEYRLFSVPRSMPRNTEPPPTLGKNKKPTIRMPQFDTRWSVAMPVLVRAMVKAGDTIFAAGPRDTVDEPSAFKTFDDPATRKSLKEQAELFSGSHGSLLWAVSAEDGTKIQETQLDVLPVFDGMIAAAGRIYMSTVDGKVVCLGSKVGRE